MTPSELSIRKSRTNYIGVLLENFPSSVRGLWLSLDDILRIVHDGGAKSIIMSDAGDATADGGQRKK